MLSHMVVKHAVLVMMQNYGLRVVLSHMVVKLSGFSPPEPWRFESSVISYGSQTGEQRSGGGAPFESSVISYGSQTSALLSPSALLFESSVISYGSQT